MMPTIVHDVLYFNGWSTNNAEGGQVLESGTSRAPAWAIDLVAGRERRIGWCCEGQNRESNRKEQQRAKHRD